MSFVNLPFLVVMGIPLLIFGYLILTDKDRFLSIFEPHVLKRLSVANEALSPRGRNLLLLLALFWMMVAMARPVVDHGEKRIVLEGISAVVALDISASMNAKDRYPNRLAFAKQKMHQLLDQMPHDELSLIAFAQVAFMMAPFSSDKEILHQIIEGVSTDSINMGSTDFRAMGHFASSLLEEKKEKILIVLSDGGEDPEGLHALSQILKAQQISLYVLLIGTQEGSPVLDKAGKPLLYHGTIPITQRNDALGELALTSGGAYVVAQRGEGDVIELVKQIKAKHQNHQQDEITIHDREEYFIYPLGLAMLFLLLGFISIPSRKTLYQKTVAKIKNRLKR